MMKHIRSTITTASAILAVIFTLEAGSSTLFASASQPNSNGSSSPITVTTTNPNRANIVYNKFLYIVKQPNKLVEANAFLKAHIYEVTSYQASMMTLRLENAQAAALPAWETDTFFTNSVQQQIAKIYKDGDDFSKLITRTKDSTLRKLFQASLDRGYKIETAEGTFFPVIDYEGYKKYHPYVTKDIKSYIDIMAVESANPPSKDAGLMISWKEVTSRALTQEAYVASFPNSNRTKQVNNLYKQYVMNTIYGQNNTPLFDYESNIMDSDARKSYETLLAESDPTDSALLKKLQAFMDVLHQNEYKLNTTVENYRKVNFPIE